MGGKNTGSDFDVWAGSHRDGGLMGGRRGSLPRGQLDSHGSNSGVSDTGRDLSKRCIVYKKTLIRSNFRS